MTVPEPRAPEPLPEGRVSRIAPLAGLAARTASEAMLASWRQRRAQSGGDSPLREFHVRNAQRYADWLGHSRGALLKAGQILATVMPAAAVDTEFRDVYRSAFGKLLDEVPPMPPETVLTTIEAELGRPVSELFAHFDERPLAAASIGQVHAATLTDGRRIAVKVQYPGAQRAIRDDLRNAELVATLLGMLIATMPAMTRVDITGMAREVTERISEELDYRVEATNQQAFADAYRGHPFIHIPEVLPELSTARVLTTELVDGLRYRDAVAADQELRDRWGEAIFRFAHCGTRRLRMVNVDPNPGNFLFRGDGSVAFLDFGCVMRLTEPQAQAMFGFIPPVTANDAEGLHRWALAVDFIDPASAPEPNELLAYWREAFTHLISAEPLTIDTEFVSRILATRVSAAGPYGDVAKALTCPPDLTLITRFDVCLLGVLAGLSATRPWRAITDEWDLSATPATPLGELDAAFWAQT